LLRRPSIQAVIYVFQVQMPPFWIFNLRLLSVCYTVLLIVSLDIAGPRKHRCSTLNVAVILCTSGDTLNLSLVAAILDCLQLVMETDNRPILYSVWGHFRPHCMVQRETKTHGRSRVNVNRGSIFR